MSTDWLPIVIGISSTVGIGYSIFRGIDSSKNERKRYYADLLSKLDGELSDIKKTEINMGQKVADILQKEGECYRYASDYLNILERISFLGNLRIIDSEMLKLFDTELAYGLKLLSWKVKVGYITSKKTYSDIVRYTENNGITEKSDESNLPQWLILLEEKRKIINQT